MTKIVHPLGGSGCGCARCKEPVPNPPMVTPEEAKRLREAYELTRRVRADHV